MDVAFLFNSDDPKFGGSYGWPILRAILATGVLQSSERNIRVSLGDILTYGKLPTKRISEVYKTSQFDHLNGSALRQTFGKATVYCWMVQNIGAAIAERLDEKLKGDSSYLGAMDVDLSQPLHLAFFRNFLIDRYRFQGRHCSMFYTMGENEDPQLAEKEALEEAGFSVTFEDTGARKTIFDDYDTLEHWSRVGDFKRVFATFEGLDEDRASDLALSLEELHPKLFDGFASAARAIERAETSEDFAQAALSGRRLLEQTADYLFPPLKAKLNGRDVGPANYRNRIWAYIERAAARQSHATLLLTHLGSEADRLFKLFNTGLHANTSRSSIEEAFRDLVLWLSEVLILSPEEARKPYLAYEGSMIDFFSEMVGQTPRNETTGR